MSDGISAILSQIRSMQAQSTGFVKGINAASPVASPAGSQVSFSDSLKSALAKVSANQLESKRLRTAFELGEPGVDLTKIMLASQEAQIGFKAVVEVRNRLVQAYQDVMNMPV